MSSNIDSRDALLITGVICTCLGAVAFCVAIGYFASNSSLAGIAAILMAAVATGAVGSLTYGYAHRSPERFPTEQEILTPRQRRELRRARAQVVMQKALDDVRKEQENIEHARMLDAGDDTTPPHVTSWTQQDDTVKQIRPRQTECAHGYRKGQCGYAGCENY